MAVIIFGLIPAISTIVLNDSSIQLMVVSFTSFIDLSEPYSIHLISSYNKALDVQIGSFIAFYN